MKKTLLAGLFALMGIFASAETKISVTQSIRYGNGQYAEMDSPQISLEKARKEGGKVFLRYEFEVKEKGWLDCDSIYAFLKFPSEYRLFSNEYVLKVTALTGATDVAFDLLEAYKGEDVYSTIQDSLGRLPDVREWIIQQAIKENKSDSYKFEDIEDAIGVLLRIPNVKGNKARIEFCLDFNAITYLYEHHSNGDEEEYAEWIRNNALQVIPIDLSFHNQYKSDCGYEIPEYMGSGFGLYFAAIYVTNLDWWKRQSSNSDHSFTFFVRD